MYLITPDGSTAYSSDQIQYISAIEIDSTHFEYQIGFTPLGQSFIFYNSTKQYPSAKAAVNAALGLINQLLNTQQLT